VFFSS